MKPSGHGLLFWGRFSITASISVLVIDLFIISISSWFSLGRLNFSENLSISSMLSILSEKAMATHYSTLAWKIPWTEEPGCSPWGKAKSRTRLNGFTFTFHFSLSCIGKGNGNPLQCSYLENPRDSGAWWAAICGVPQSRTRLK